jgi:peptidyl-prolyl cis-trans isomerase SurA
MRFRFSLSFVLVLLLPAFCLAQELNEKTLMTIDDKNVEAGEFIRMYRKSIEPGKESDVVSYLDQFIIFKLKVADAVKEGYDTTNAFRTELLGYRNQLSQNYLTDNEYPDKLLKKEYDRSLTDINAWHILIALSPDASPADTLKAWKKATDIREEILKGEPFEKAARRFSDDKSVISNGGDLGYFNVFQMIMPFEDVAYSLGINEISGPVRSQYGYHIIKVTGRQPSKGRVKVAHIMKAVSPDASAEVFGKAKEKIDSIYTQLQHGISFGKLAELYSDDRESANRGGELDWFRSGEIIKEFSDAAFSIADTGLFTKPFRTPYGWHIVKLLDRKKTGTFNEEKSFLQSRINKSYLASLSRKSFVEKLKKDYEFSIDAKTLNWFIRHTDSLIIDGAGKYDRRSMPQSNIYTFADQKFTAGEFADFIEKKSSKSQTNGTSDYIKANIESSAAESLLKYENLMLEKKNDEFRYLMNEFHDGILLFEISGKKVWNRVNEDTIGLKKYYDKHKTEYLSKPGITAKIYILHNFEGEGKLASAFKRYKDKVNFDDLMIRKFNKRNDTLLTIKECRWFKGDESEIDSISWETGSRELRYKGFPAVLSIESKIEQHPMDLREVQGEMMTGFQDYLENEWVVQLKKKYSVSIDNMVLTEVKKELSNE